VLTDAGGVPLVVQVAAANTHDVRTAVPLIVAAPAVAGKPGRPRHKPATVVADKGFDSGPLRSLLRWLGITPRIPRRGRGERGLGRTRWAVERTLSWLHQFRRLRIRWDRNVAVHQAFLDLAAAVICYRLWAGGS
jgi:transposase